MEDETLIEAPVGEQRESTSEDYWNTLNPFAIQYNNPNTRFNAATDSKGVIDYEAPAFKAAFDLADIETKRAMIDARNESDALKIYERRAIFMDSQKAIEQDGLMTQIGMGIIPSLASPTSLLPGGAYVKAAQMASRVNKIVTLAGTGALAGAGANIIDEALFDAQGMPTNYIGAAGIGAIFGGGLGAIGGALSGPHAKTVGHALSQENDTFTKDFHTDPIINSRLDEEGNVQLQDIGQMDKSITDRIPFIGSWLKSDIHRVFQSESAILRGYMGRMASATVSLRDSAGNLMPVKFNGTDFKRKLKGVHNRLNRDVSQTYEEARVSGFQGTRDDFNTEVYKVYVNELNRQKTDANAYANQKTAHFDLESTDQATITAFRKAHAEAKDEWYDANPPMFKGDPHLVKAAENYRNYFGGMLESGQKLNMKGIAGVKKNRLYAPRVYNYRALHKGDISPETALSQIRAALEGDVRNGFRNVEELEAHAKGVYDMLMDTAFDLNNLTNSFFVKDLPFETHLKSKKLYLDETKMYDLLRTDFEEVAGMYHYKMSGRQATQFAFGTDDFTEIQDIIRKDHRERGVMENKEEIQAFENTVKDLLGDLRMNGLSDTAGWTFTRNLLTYNSTRMGGGFGGNQFIELASAMAMNGFDALMTGRFKQSLVNSKNLLFTKGQDVDEFSEYLINSGYMSDALHTSRINRYADTEAGFNSGKLENKLNWMSDKLMKYNGMRYFMGVMEDYTGAAIVTKLKKGNVDERQLARWGLTKEEAGILKGKLNTATAGDKWDLSQLSNDEQDWLQMAISRGIDEVVVQGDSMHLPIWLKAPDPFKKVLFQFMRFPLIAQETLTRKGFKEGQAEMMAAMMASSAAYVGLKYLREQAAIATGQLHEVDAKYDYMDNPDTLQRSLLESLNYNAPLGFTSSIYNYGAIAAGQPELGRDWQGKHGMPSLMGPSFGLGEDLIQLIRAGVEGNLDTERSLQRFKALTPFMNLPIINEAGKAFVEEYGR